MSFSWTCPFCNHKATIQEDNRSAGRHQFNCNNKYGYQAVITNVIACPNKDCKEYTLTVSLHDHEFVGRTYEDRKAKKYGT